MKSTSFRRAVVGVLASSMLVGTAQISAAVPHETVSDDNAAISDLTAAALEDVGAAGLTADAFDLDGGTATTDDGVTVSGADVTLTGAGGIEMTLPVDESQAPVIAEGGTLVYAATAPGLHLEVQGVDGGTARVLTVAEQDYSTSTVHEYAYDIDLPSGAQLVAGPDGAVHVLRDPASISDTVTAADLEAVDLSSLLPDVSEADLAVRDTAVAAASSGQALGTEPVMVGSFQASWAVDANGTALPSHYQVRGDQLVQVVDTAGATFPVVSDPIPLIVIGLGVAARALAPTVARAFAAQAIRAGAAFTTRGGYTSFTAFKNAAGSRAGYQWHHIVEQSAGRARGWDVRGINHPNNLVQIPTQVHQRCVSSWMARKNVSMFGIATRSGETMRAAVQRLSSYSAQHRVGVELLRYCGVQI